jgi:hypothetical protein
MCGFRLHGSVRPARLLNLYFIRKRFHAATCGLCLRSTCEFCVNASTLPRVASACVAACNCLLFPSLLCNAHFAWVCKRFAKPRW